MHSIELRKNDNRQEFNFEQKLDMFSTEKSKTYIRASFYQKNYTNVERLEKTEVVVPAGKEKFRYATPAENLKYLL